MEYEIILLHEQKSIWKMTNKRYVKNIVSGLSDYLHCFVPNLFITDKLEYQ